MNIEGFKLMSEIVSKSTEWLWDGRIPLGEVTILEGHPGTNKSSLTDDLAARLTKGKAMPCVSSKQNRKGGVLFLIGEDSPSKTVKGRLLAAEADLSKVGILEHIAIPDDILTVEKAVIKLDAKLIVVDSINDFLHCNVLETSRSEKPWSRCGSLRTKEMSP